MSFQEASRWVLVAVLLVVGQWAFSFPIQQQQAAFLAQAATPVICQDKKGAMTVEEECKPGCEYLVRPSYTKQGSVDVLASVSDPTGKLPGTVKYRDGKGTIIMICDGTVGKSLDKHTGSVQAQTALPGQGPVFPAGQVALMLPTSGTGQISASFSGSSGGYTPTPLETRESVSSDFFGTGPSGSLGAAPNPAVSFDGSLGGEYCLGQFCPVEGEGVQRNSDALPNDGNLNGETFGNVAEINSARIPQNVGIENALIADRARLNMSNDLRIYSAAQEWSGFQKEGKLDEPQYVGVDGQRTIAQSINARVRDYAQQDVGYAVAEVTGTTAAGEQGVLVSYTKDTVLARDPYDGSLLFADSKDQLPVLYTADGQAVPTSNQAGDWVGVMKERIQTPAELREFEKAYTGVYSAVFTPADIKVPGLKLDMLPENARNTFDSLARWDGNGPESMGASNDVIIRSLSGEEKLRISDDVYRAMHAHENQVYGIDAAASRIERDTQGKMNLNISGLPQETNVGGSLAPAYALVPLPGELRAWTASAIETELGKYPPEYWENANKGAIYDFMPRPDMQGVVREGGHATVPGDPRAHIYLNGLSGAAGIAVILNHELSHFNDDKTFVSDQTFGTNVYGPAYGMSYAGSSGYEAIMSGKFDIGRPDGFADSYGYRGGVQEDKASIVEAMFTNYSVVQQAAQTDTVLAQKVQILQSGFEKSTNGAMNETYWQNLKPIDPWYQLPPSVSRPSFLRTLMSKLWFK